MVPVDFQLELMKEIEEITSEITYKLASAEGGTKNGVTAYRQQLPVITADEEDADQFFPYAIIRLEGGETQDDNDCWSVKTDILIGCYDDNQANDGHLDVLETIQRITDRFAKRPLLARKYYATQHIQWALQDEDTYPYYFGGVEITFNLPKIGREDDYA